MTPQPITEDALQDTITNIKSLEKSANTKAAYCNAIVGFVYWLYINRPTLVDPTLLANLQAATSERLAKNVAREWFKDHSAPCPFDLHRLTGQWRVCRHVAQDLWTGQKQE